MFSAESLVSDAVELKPKLIEGIPVRNLWLLMLYASELYRELACNNIAIEENPDQIPDLVAEILCSQIDKRLARNLSYTYQQTSATINRVRGRIDLLYTERHRLLDKGKVQCHFEKLTIDTPRNQYVRAAVDSLANIVSTSQMRHRCKCLSLTLDKLGVTKGKPANYSLSTERFGRHDAADKKMVTAAFLAFNIALPTERSGKHALVSPSKDIRWIRNLFEKGIAGFYSVVLDSAQWRVKAGTKLNWQIESKSSAIDTILPSMRTDITLENTTLNTRLIIDTKFNAITKKGQYRDETLRSGYIYQIYAYVRSQENNDDPLSMTASGMLLHPSVGNTINESAVIQGHCIRFRTIDLSKSANSVRHELLKLTTEVTTIV